MNSESKAVLQRRDFLKLAGATSVYSLSRGAGAVSPRRVDAQDAIASSTTVRRAAEKLRKEAAAKGITCNLVESTDQAAGSDLCILVAPPTSVLAHGFPVSFMGQSATDAAKRALKLATSVQNRTALSCSHAFAREKARIRSTAGPTWIYI